MEGKFIIIEGADCSGKSTFVKHLIGKADDRIVFSNEPGGVPYGQKIRHLLLNDEFAEESDNTTKFHLYWASKAENFAKAVLPNLKQGKTVVSDRFEGSTYGYQVGENPHLKELFWLTREICLQGVQPVYFYFEVDVQTQIQRSNKRSGEQNYFDRRREEYREKIILSYEEFFNDSRVDYYRIDASRPLDEMLAQGVECFRQVTGIEI